MIIQQQPSSLSDRPQVSSMLKSRRSVSPAEPPYRLAQVLVEQEKWEDAIAAYQRTLTIAPTWVEVQRELGDLFLKLERWDEAVQVYEIAIGLRSDTEVYHNLGDALLKLQRWEDAIAAYEKAIELNPEFSWSYNNLGDGLRELQRWDEAAQTYRKAIELKPDFALSHHNLGDILVKKEDWEGAIAAYQKAIELDPNFVWSYYNLGDVLVKKEDWENAIAAYRSAVKLDPNLPQVHEKLGDALQHQIQSYSEEISQVYHRAVADNPTDLQVYYKALEVNPKDAEMCLKLADTLKSQGKLEQAITFYKSTLQIEPNDPEIQTVAWQKLSDVLRHLGHFEEAAKSYHQLVELNQKSVGSDFMATNRLNNLQQREDNEFSAKNSMTRFEYITTDKLSYKIGIKTSVPNLSESPVWGDFHFAHALKRAFERLGHTARVDCNDVWKTEGLNDDVVIILRGRHGYKPKSHQINLLWLISHPDRITSQEMNLFDHIFVASKEYTQKLSKQIKVPVSCMYQCTDPNLFYQVNTIDVPASKILFLGGSRNVYRPIVRDAINLDIDIDIYGPLWEKFVSKKFIKGTHIDNKILHKYYSNCTILLNDHWETMRQEGFLSNRLFDGGACGAFIITDKVVGLDEVFGDYIETYEYPNELKEKINYYLENQKERHNKASQAKEIVLKNHTFDHRARQFLEIITSIKHKHHQIVESQLTQVDSGIKDGISQKILSSTISGLENGLCNVELIKDSIFYKWLWRISRQTPNYQNFVSQFILSESQLIDSLKPPYSDEKIPLVSIIMPTFNRAYVIADGIQSIIEQTYKNWELFVCDDGSTDNTKAVVDQFEDSRIHYLQLEKANGAVARNFGLQSAKGKYIAYLDSDNIWHHQHLNLCIKNLESQPHAMCCYTGYIDTEYNKSTLEFSSLSCKPFNYYRLLDKNFIDLNTFVHKRKLYEWLGGFDETLVRLQDWDLLLRYLFIFPPLIIENFTVFYRRNIAWNQVTKLFIDLDLRNFVQKKMISSIENGLTSLDIKFSYKPLVSLLCSEWSERSWLRALSFANLLSEVFEVQVLLVADSFSEKRATELKKNKLEIQLLEVNTLGKYTAVNDIFNSQDGCHKINNILSVIKGDVLMIIGDCEICHAVALATKIFDSKPLILMENIYKKIMQNSQNIVDQNQQINLVFNKQGVSESIETTNSVRFEDVWKIFNKYPQVLIREINNRNTDLFSSIAVGPTILYSSVKDLNSDNIQSSSKLEFKEKCLVIVFWSDTDAVYQSDQINKFQNKFKNYPIKILIIKSVGTQNDETKNHEQSETDNRIITVMKEDVQQVIDILNSADICIYWKGEEWSNSNEFVSLPLVYSLACGCVPISNEIYKFCEFEKPNYCCHVKSGDWNKLIKICQRLYNDPNELAKLKVNGRRLYNLRFSPNITKEILKYIVYQSLSYQVQYEM